MFVPLGTEGLSIEAIKFRLNVYTGPGYLNALLGVVYSHYLFGVCLSRIQAHPVKKI